VIRVENLAKTFHLPRGRVVDAVRGVSFAVQAGEVYGLLGPNGAGKTTLLRMLATILTPTSGRCFVSGIRSDEDPDEARRHIGFLSGNTRLYGRLTPREVLAYFGRLYGMEEGAIVARSRRLEELLDMGELMDRRCESLSTGQLQRASIARVLVHDPPVLILDEPTLGLDIMTSSAILDFIAEAKTRGRCILYSTHYMTEAELLCDRVGLIHKGRILAEGSQERLYERTQTSNLKDAFLRLVDESDTAASALTGNGEGAA
jgi:sodium transport system ATP-binding protein